MDIISFDDFKKLEIRIGKIISAEKVEGSDRLMKLEVDFGVNHVEEVGGRPTSSQTDDATSSTKDIRQIIAGIAQFYAPEALIGKECPFAYNLAPRVLKGLESQGMILCPSDEAGPVLLHPDKKVPPGNLIK